MIQYLTNKEVDRGKWDACIEQALNGIIYVYSWYLDMASPEWCALVENDYESVMPLPTKQKWGVKYAYQPFFIQQLGVYSTRSLSPDVTSRFVAAIPAQYRYVDINLNTFNGIRGKQKGARLLRLRTYELDLIGSYDSLKRAYSSNTLRNIKKAENSGVFVTRQGRPEDIIDAFRLHKGKEVKAFGEEAYNLLKHIIYSGMHRRIVETYFAYSAQNSFCAGAVFLVSHHKAIFLFSAATEDARSNGAMFLLVDRFIQNHSTRTLILDFEGSSDPGLARFYAGFGSKECVFLRLVLNRFPFYLKPLLLLYNFLRHGTTGFGEKVQVL